MDKISQLESLFETVSKEINMVRSREEELNSILESKKREEEVNKKFIIIKFPFNFKDKQIKVGKEKGRTIKING